MKEVVLDIQGMTCDHCEVTVKNALQKVAGLIEILDVSYESASGRVVIADEADSKKLADAINQTHYRATVRGEKPIVLEFKPVGKEKADFDLVVIGGGSAGFAAAIRGSELGARVGLVSHGTLGGTCVNVGCVPSKTLIRAAESLHRAQRTPFDGLSVEGRLRDFGQVVAQKDALVSTLREHKYADVLGSLPNVQLIEGRAQFVEAGALRVGDSVLHADRFVVTTGARPHAASISGLDKVGYLTSTSALDLRELPESLIVLGGRYIALELAQAFARLGSRVTILQRSDHILPTEDDDLTEALAGYLRDEGIDVRTGVLSREVRQDSTGYSVEAGNGDKLQVFRGAQLLVATGRRANSEGMGLDRLGVTLGDDATIAVDDSLQTTAPGVYAAGDIIGEPAFVYTAAYEGNLAAENALSATKRKRDYTALPWVIFTDPQIAAVGLNERRAREAGVAVDVTRLPLSQVPRALAARDTRGFIKLLKERGGDRLLGAVILAPEAGDLIMEPALAIRHGIGASQLASAFHPYLTQAEGIKLAAQTFHKDISKLSCCAA